MTKSKLIKTFWVITFYILFILFFFLFFSWEFFDITTNTLVNKALISHIHRTSITVCLHVTTIKFLPGMKQADSFILGLNSF